MCSRFARNGRRATEILYTADGKIKTRGVAGGDAVPIEFTAAMSFTRTPYQAAVRDFDSRNAQPVRGIMSPVISPDGTQVAFAALGDLWLMPIGPSTSLGTGGAPPADQRSLRRDAIRPGRPTADRSRSHPIATARWISGCATSHSGADTKIASEATKASWAPRGNEIAYINRDGALAITGRTAPVHAPDVRDRPADLGARGLDRGHDAAAVLDTVSRGHQPVAAGVDNGRSAATAESRRASLDRHARRATGRCGRATARRWRSSWTV